MPTSTLPRSVPQEVLEHIAFLAGTQSLVGPPSDLPSLLLTCRDIYQALSLEANPYLYARIFCSKFDTSSVFRRLGSHVNAPRVLANELKKRWLHLRLIRARTNSRIGHAEPHQPSPALIDLLWLAYLMMLENDGKNERQLVDYAEMDVWLMEYWFDDEGASSAAHMILRNAWPIEDEKNSIAMWLFWFLLRPSLIMRNITRFPHIKTIMKLTALAANHVCFLIEFFVMHLLIQSLIKYPICRPSWTEFLPRTEAILPPSVITHFSEAYRLNPPTLAPAAILTFITLALRILVPAQAGHAEGLPLRSPASLSLTMRRSEDWDTDWYRCINVGQSDRCGTPSEAYILGSMDGVWEGVFTVSIWTSPFFKNIYRSNFSSQYTEFTAYSMLLSGGAPPAFDHCLVAHHRQTWKLREYYLVEAQELTQEKSRPLGPGNPLRAHFPAGTRLRELSDFVEIREPGTNAVHYRRASHAEFDVHKVVDIIILGEGHSAWGQFNLYGRPNLNIAKLKRKMDISSLTLQIAGENIFEKGRFYMLWRVNGNFIIIQAEPWWRPGFVPDITLPMNHYLEEHRALWHLQEVIQTMLDTIVFDGENNWAHLVRLKDNSYRLVYRKRRLIHNCPIWTKVINDLGFQGDSQLLCTGKDIDIFIGWQDDWGAYVSAESRGQKLIQSMGLGQYFFDLKAHVSKNGVIVGIMMEALVGRCVTPADRSAVFEAVADIQQHGISFSFQICDIYITKRGVRFASASSAKHYRDRDTLAEEAKFTWQTLADIFNHMEDESLRGRLSGSRSMGSSAFIIPRLPSPGRPLTLTPEEAIIRWVWSITTSDQFCRFQGYAFMKLRTLYRSSEHLPNRRDKRIKGDSRALLPPDDFSGDLEVSGARIESVDEPLIVNRGLVARRHPYARPTSKRLLLPQEFDLVVPAA
ncbi:hypothetical protein J3R83DRAFT_11372 [Lanmaoa asiatica]|nr:hypothetical protein J3R83DRAFT_11372 [Lanmaoa asiatica]